MYANYPALDPFFQMNETDEVAFGMQIVNDTLIAIIKAQRQIVSLGIKICDIAKLKNTYIHLYIFIIY